MKFKALAVLAAIFSVQASNANSLYQPGSSWAALSADRKAAQPGDILTILIYENSTATNSAGSASSRASRLSGRAAVQSHFDEQAELGLTGNSDNKGSTGLSGRMVAQISAVVDEVLPNGDLKITGSQFININKNRTHIQVRGRVRTADISAENAVMSSRIADAMIDYNGSGFVSRSGKPGIVTRLFNLLGLM